MAKFETVTGPAFAASYLVNGDDSDLADIQREQVDAWREREGIASVHSIKEDSERFTWSGLVYYPEGGTPGLEVCDYVCSMREESSS